MSASPQNTNDQAGEAAANSQPVPLGEQSPPAEKTAQKGLDGSYWPSYLLFVAGFATMTSVILLVWSVNSDNRWVAFIGLGVFGLASLIWLTGCGIIFYSIIRIMLVSAFHPTSPLLKFSKVLRNFRTHVGDGQPDPNQ